MWPMTPPDPVERVPIMTDSTRKTLGVILAGGQARRMGGGDKGLLDLDGRKLLEEVIARAAPQCDDLVINANGPPARFASYGLPVIADSLADFPGPLAGVLAGMDHAATRGFSHVLSFAADTPFFPPDLGEKLHAAIGPDQPIAISATRGQDRVIRQPTFGLWPVALREDLRHSLRDGLSKILLWAERHGYALVAFDGTDHDPFFNVNTAEDLAQARRIWQKITQG